ncbi:MAG: septal ring lytic transglycosylase RlpA family protein [Coriobacteriia bacterium]|nr:septal ring lytic transglycosylase RlpA family protein [Coriobacteriia bacterium]
MSSRTSLPRTIALAAAVIGTAALVIAAAVILTGPAPLAFASIAEPVNTLGVEPDSTQLLTGPVSAQAKFGAVVAVSTTATPQKLLVSAKKRAIPKKVIRTVKKASKPWAGPWRGATASWYGPGFYGRTTANGTTLTRSSMNVAHKTLKFGTRIQFKYKNRLVIAIVNDRGPFIRGRDFDLGPGTARAVGFDGVGQVQYRIINKR